MDEKKSVLSNNQAVENLEHEFQFAKWTNGENASDAAIKQYNRDILLQLRLHPLSLQKPKELPEMEVIKDKLYLDDIADMTSNSPEKHMDTSNYHTTVKPDYYNVKPDFSLSPYFTRMYPYCYSSHAYNGSYQSAPVKCRSSFNTYCNPLKKHCIATHQCLKDISLEEYPWMKPFPSPDDLWNCYPNHAHSGFYKRKENSEAVPKSKKKLQIIDPATGKNVLETVFPCQSEESSVGDGSCCIKGSNDKTAENSKSDETSYDSIPFSSDDNTSFDKPKNSDAEVNINRGKLLRNDGKEISNNASSTIENNKDTEFEDKKSENHETLDVKNNMYDFTKTSEKTLKYDASKYSKQVPKISHNRDMNSYFDVHGTCRAHSIKECHMHSCNENLSKQHDVMQESLRQLREKICSLKQEEQKIAILQSFLRYKKYQLEESAKNLDEKRIEIANWEYNLYNKAKRLHEKEQWLENKKEMLNSKTQQLVEKEKILNEEEKISCDTLYSNTFKESDVPQKKFTFDNNTTIWNEISKMKNTRINDENEYFVRYESKSTKIPEVTSSNIEKCKSDAFSLDELEKNLAFIEKMHSSSEINDSPVDKLQLVSSPNTVQKSDETASYDPLECSKGRHYLPEHMKYWLDKRDKNAL